MLPGTTIAGVPVSRVGFGAAPLGGLYEEVTDEQAVGAVAAAVDAGVRLFDTAPLYGHGLSEIRLGRALAALGPAGRNVTVATKVGRLLRPGNDPDTIFRGI